MLVAGLFGGWCWLVGYLLIVLLCLCLLCLRWRAAVVSCLVYCTWCLVVCGSNVGVWFDCACVLIGCIAVVCLLVVYLVF